MTKPESELNQFLYIVSHDLQEPLRHICAYSEMLNELLEEKNPEVQVCIAKIDQGTRKISAMLQGLLQLSRIKKDTLHLADNNLDTVFINALKKFKESSKELSPQINGNIPLTARFDEKLFELLFANLISNSMKFRQNNIDPKISLNCSESKDFLEIEFKDNGIGIEEEYYEKIFKVFQKLHPDSQFPGLGLGLSYCKKIIEEHGGSINVASKVKEGTTFRFTLPK